MYTRQPSYGSVAMAGSVVELAHLWYSRGLWNPSSQAGLKEMPRGGRRWSGGEKEEEAWSE